MKAQPKKLKTGKCNSKMKKLLGSVLGFALLGAFSGGVALSQTPPPSPTTCPTNYQCSFLITGNFPLEGAKTDGEPSSEIGFMNFDANSNITGVFSGNFNGNVFVNDPSGSGISATCTSGTASSLGTLTINVTVPGQPQPIVLTYDFVMSSNAAGPEMFLSGETKTTPADTPVSVGVCRATGAVL